MFRNLLLTFAVTAALASPVIAEDDPQLARIATMPIEELDAFIGSVSSAVNQDTLKMRGFAQSNDCLDLTRAANSFALGYSYLAAIRDTATERKGREAQVIHAKAIQARVSVFAARVRAEEWLKQRCRSFSAPAEQAADPRYKTPPKVSNPEYTEAVIEARQAADTNLAIAVAAGLSGRCPEAIVAGRNVSLLIPYLEKLLNDTARRPEVLGPRASRRGLEVSRRQLLAARDKLQSQFGEKCRVNPASGTEAAPDSQ